MKKVLAGVCCTVLALSIAAGSLTAYAAQADAETGAAVEQKVSGETLDTQGFTIEITDFGKNPYAEITKFSQTVYASSHPNYNNDHILEIPPAVESSKGETVPVTDIYIGSEYGWEDGKDANTFTKVFIPKSVETIGSSFEGLSNLEYVEFEEGSNFGVVDGVHYHTFNSFSFSGCTNLKKVGIGDTDKLPEGLVNISYDAFSDCAMLQSITLPYGLESISGNAFEGCNSLKRISIPATVKTIDVGAFHDCTGLESAVFETYSEGENIGKSDLTTFTDYAFYVMGAFENCTSLKEVELPVSTSSNGYVINNQCFKNTALTGINIPESVRSVGADAFADTKLDENGLTVLDGKSKGEKYGIAFFGKATTIDNEAFGDVKPTIAGYDNSNADSYAIKNQLDFVSLGDWDPFKNQTLSEPESKPESSEVTSSTTTASTKTTSSAKTASVKTASTKTTSTKTTSVAAANTKSSSSSSSSSSSTGSTATSPKTGAVSPFFGTLIIFAISAAAIVGFSRRKESE